MLNQCFGPKLAKFQNNGKNEVPSGACEPPGGTIFLSEILILASSISYLSMFKITKWFLWEKIQSFVGNFKNLEVLQSKRDFFNFLQVITFDHSC